MLSEKTLVEVIKKLKREEVKFDTNFSIQRQARFIISEYFKEIRNEDRKLKVVQLHAALRIIEDYLRKTGMPLSIRYSDEVFIAGTGKAREEQASLSKVEPLADVLCWLAEALITK